MFLVIFIDLEGLTSLPTYPKKGSKTNIVHSQKFIWWVRLILKFLKMVLRKEKGPQGIE